MCCKDDVVADDVALIIKYYTQLKQVFYCSHEFVEYGIFNTFSGNTHFTHDLFHGVSILIDSY